MLIERIGRYGHLNPLPVACDDRQEGRPCSHDPHGMLQQRHVEVGQYRLGEMPGRQKARMEDRTRIPDTAANVSSHPLVDRMSDRPLDTLDGVATLALVQPSIEVLGDAAELDDQIVAEVQRKSLSALFAPEPDQLVPIFPHDDPGVGSAYEAAAIA